MNIDLYSICYNESQILPYFLRYYSQFCRSITFFDNFSTDRSRKIIQSFPNTQIIDFATNKTLNDSALIEIKNNCWKSSDADYVIVCDADEFLYNPNLIEFLESNKLAGYNLFRPYGYQMCSETFPRSKKQLPDVVKHGVYCDKYSKSIIFDPNVFAEMNYEPGAHYCDPQNKEGTKIKIYDGEELKVLHYHYLGLSRVINRLHRYRPRVSEINRLNGWGVNYLESDVKVAMDYSVLMATAKEII